MKKDFSSNLKKIIIFTISPINEDYLKRYGYDFFLKKDKELIFLNLCYLLYGKDKTESAGYDKIGKCPQVQETQIDNYFQLLENLRKYSENSIIYINITASARLMFMIFLSKIPYIEGSLWGGIQEINWTKNKNVIEQISSKFFSITRNFKKKIFGKIDYFTSIVIRKINPPCIILSSSSVQAEMVSDEKFLLNHTFDYDRFIMNTEMQKPSYIPDFKYYVLLPNHAWMVHDYIINNAEKDCSMSKKNYQKLINNTLCKIEELSGVKILVAGYPNATKDEDIYINRDFLLGTETEQLVKYSSGVITHFSGAINFAVIHNKPICLINYRDFDSDPRFLNPIRSYSNLLDIPINYIDNDNDIEELVSKGIFCMNFKEYQEYLFNFICPKEIFSGKKELFWERVMNKIE
ncbi:hypothetical protein OA953_01205 [Gammaproteobacteria bacterium]|nr:hypothetical protein [Gammaproteobacteria bacterium]